MTYDELLLQHQWWEKCNTILSRDHYTCQDCGMLGFHNGGNYMKLSKISEIDSIMPSWRIKDLPISKFVNDLPIQIEDRKWTVDFEEINENGSTYVYKLSLQSMLEGKFNIFTLPTGVNAVCDCIFTSCKAKAYYSSCVSHLQDTSYNGWLLYLEFEKVLSISPYLNIEYYLHRYEDVGDGFYPIDSILVNITTGNKILSIKLVPFLSGIKSLNVHHKYYIRGNDPWNYSNEALITLCEQCHKKRHQETKIPVYDKNNMLVQELEPCPKCGGSGYLPQYHYHDNGICYECWGEGVII
ncbi:MAG: hypothetical protein IKQ59_09890 [Prevotella sp.]|nr:hypothetical protein [Prevotella sp.]